MRIDPDSGQVIDSDMNPIPGLYAAGELVGGIFYFNYPGGSGLMSGAVFGRIAGTGAATATECVMLRLTNVPRVSPLPLRERVPSECEAGEGFCFVRNLSKQTPHPARARYRFRARHPLPQGERGRAARSE